MYVYARARYCVLIALGTRRPLCHCAVVVEWKYNVAPIWQSYYRVKWNRRANIAHLGPTYLCAKATIVWIAITMQSERRVITNVGQILFMRERHRKIISIIRDISAMWRNILHRGKMRSETTRGYSNPTGVINQPCRIFCRPRTVRRCVLTLNGRNQEQRRSYASSWKKNCFARERNYTVCDFWSCYLKAVQQRIWKLTFTRAANVSLRMRFF